ncbi:DUF2971 domain-containing protein [Methanosarcina soligelidi]|uniref:DUF2971 domain-containing protein n=1 Tax=Methanosarcina soligelidi TaxID=1036677 RepID=UPI001363C0EE|nr:DUF2971 domain-containing protein [Methanosarcina soligelidi]
MKHDDNHTVDNLSHKQLYFRDPDAFEDNDDFNIMIYETMTEEKIIELIALKKKCDPSKANEILNDYVNNGTVKKEGNIYTYYQKVKKLTRVCCFSKTCNSRKMWEKHADNHQGICLCFQYIEETNPGDYNKYIFTQQGVVCPLYDVIYVPSFNDPDAIDMSNNYRHTQAFDRGRTKKNDYIFEEECRIIYSRHVLENDILNYFESDLRGIIFGSRITRENAELVYKTIRENYEVTVEFYKSIETSDRDTVKIEKIPEFGEYIQSLT